MNFIRWATVITFAAIFHLASYGQTPPQAAAPATDPTMEQTMAFIRGAFSEHSDISWIYPTVDKRIQDQSFRNQSIALDPPCTIHYSYLLHWVEDSQWIWSLRMDLADPRTIKVEPDNDSKPIVWRISIRYDLDQPLLIIDGKPEARYFQGKLLRPDISLGTFFDKDLAQRVAKAYIHAIVLCQKPKAPSPF